MGPYLLKVTQPDVYLVPFCDSRFTQPALTPALRN